VNWSDIMGISDQSAERPIQKSSQIYVPFFVDDALNVELATLEEDTYITEQSLWVDWAS